MSDRRVGTLILNGQDSIDFADSFFRPTQEQVEVNREKIDKIKSGLTLSKNGRGFTIDVIESSKAMVSSEEIIPDTEIDINFSYLNILENTRFIETESILIEKVEKKDNSINGNIDSVYFDCVTDERYKKANRDSLSVAA